VIAETSRMILREFHPEDAENLYLLNLDPEVIRYTGDKSFEDISGARTFIQNYDHYRNYGFGRWGMIRKHDLSFLGWCGLKYSPEAEETDIGFRIFRTYWNQGYATEAARECLRAGFTQFGLKTITGRARTENTASIRVLEKIGLSYHRTFLKEGERWKIYRIDKQELN
jgi:[ribosomal protein S5]-alanine N-acetyltransferase